MKLLLLLRHASAESGAGVDDHDRRLSPAGRDQAAAVAARLAADGQRPDVALCSSARRAQETLEAFTGVCDPGATRVSEQLYLAAAADLLAAVRAVEDSAATVLVVGHNPGLQRLALSLVDGADGRALEGFPPAAVAGLRFDVPRWADVGDGGGQVVVSPRG